MVKHIMFHSETITRKIIAIITVHHPDLFPIMNPLFKEKFTNF